MELPIRIAVFDKTKKEHGLKCISLVDRPAIGFMAVKMSEQNEFKLAIQDEEQRIIFTPVLVPDQLIYREVKGEKFNLVFTKETIADIAVDWSAKMLSNAVDINHSEKLIDGVTWFESFVLNEKRVSKAEGFENIPMGTWFVSGKVESDEVWGKIKSGEIKGVSIDGVFDAMLVQQSTDLTDDEYDKLIQDILSNF